MLALKWLMWLQAIGYRVQKLLVTGDPQAEEYLPEVIMHWKQQEKKGLD